MTQYLTLGYTNQATISCPIFGVETKLAACMKLRDKVWQGQNPPIRKGCQACMSANKCPAAQIVNTMIYGKKENADTYGSHEPKNIKLRDNILERILPVVVRPETMRKFGVSDQEQALIETANDRIRKQMVSAPSSEKESSYSPKRSAKPKATPKPTAEVNTARAEAARSGDMSAAISA
jgi:hypothetical protein